jgi:hypothetical protein
MYTATPIAHLKGGISLSTCIPERLMELSSFKGSSRPSAGLRKTCDA